MTSQLDTFETELLHELRSTVAARCQERRAPRPHRARRVIRRTEVAVGAAAAAAVAAVVTLSLRATPAYAVDNGPHGTITVQVNRLEDAADLQRALAEHGVKANVTYLGFGMGCSPGRYHPADSAANSATEFQVGEGIKVRLDRRDIARGETVVIAASRIRNGIHGEVGVAKGPVRACDPIPLPPAWVHPDG
jgi:hypothetical protein